jgi:hypothetical protein
MYHREADALEREEGDASVVLAVAADTSALA